MKQSVADSQLDLFLSCPASEADKIAYLVTCPWLHGRYRNKLWRHSLHALSSYPSKLRPQIAGFFIEYFSRPGDTVFDPMAGSGTIPLQACLLGRKGVGVDLSPYAHVLTRTKVEPPPLPAILARLDGLEKNLSPHARSDVPAQVKEFFHARTLREILAIRSKLRLQDSVDSAILSLLCGILHGGRPGFLSRRSRDIIPIRPAGAFEYRAAIPRLRAKAIRVYADPLSASFQSGTAYLGDCRDSQLLRPACAHLVVTSPPFFEHTEFVRHNWLRLWLVGWDLDEQKQRAPQFIGEKATNQVRFRSDMNQLVANIARWLKPGGFSVVHGGKKRSGEDMSQMIVDAASRCGLSLVVIIDEKIDHARKHAIRKISGESHNFIVLKKMS